MKLLFEGKVGLLVCMTRAWPLQVPLAGILVYWAVLHIRETDDRFCLWHQRYFIPDPNPKYNPNPNLNPNLALNLKPVSHFTRTVTYPSDFFCVKVISLVLVLMRQWNTVRFATIRWWWKTAFKPARKTAVWLWSHVHGWPQIISV